MMDFMSVSANLGPVKVGVLSIRALVFGVYIRPPEVLEARIYIYIYIYYKGSENNF